MRPVVIDGSQGEGGGQILRSSLALSALLGVPFEMASIRANRPSPGLRPQHLTAVRIAATLCGAAVQGAFLHSQTLSFAPAHATMPGEYVLDVADAALGGSAGAVTLIAQMLLVPLSFAAGPSRVVLRGGTHVPWSPPFHYMRDVFVPATGRLGLAVEVELVRWGWYPVGHGEFTMKIEPVGELAALEWTSRGRLISVRGVAAVTNLPAHIPQRMASCSQNLLRDAELPGQVKPLRERGPAPGAGIFLAADYEQGAAGFSALGRKGLPAEAVAEEACAALLGFHRHAPAHPVDPHLADQLIVLLALANGRSIIGTTEITQHTCANIEVVRRFLDVAIHAEQGGWIEIRGIGYHV